MGKKLDDLIEKLNNLFQTHLRRLGFIFLIFSVVLFLIWAEIAIIWPLEDTSRIRSSISLADGRKLVIDHPKRFLADGQAYPVYISVDASSPLTVELSLPSSLPLVLTKVDPQSDVALVGGEDTALVMTWPVTSTVLIATPQTTTTVVMPATVTSTVLTATPQTTTTVIPMGKSLPFEGSPNTIALYFKNAQLERPFYYSCCTWTFDAFKLSYQGKTYSEPVYVESPARAQRRLIAEKYSFIAILPLLTGAIGFLLKLYGDYKKQQEIAKKKEKDRGFER